MIWRQEKDDWRTVERSFLTLGGDPTQNTIENKIIRSMVARRILSESPDVLAKAGAKLQVRSMDYQGKSAVSLNYFLAHTGFMKNPHLQHTSRLFHFYIYQAVLEVINLLNMSPEELAHFPPVQRTWEFKAVFVEDHLGNVSRLLARHPISFSELLAQANADPSLPRHAADFPEALEKVLHLLSIHLSQHFANFLAIIMTTRTILGLLPPKGTILPYRGTNLIPRWGRLLMKTCWEAQEFKDAHERGQYVLNDPHLRIGQTFKPITEKLGCFYCGKFCEAMSSDTSDRGEAKRKIKEFKQCSNCRTAMCTSLVSTM